MEPFSSWQKEHSIKSYHFVTLLSTKERGNSSSTGELLIFHSSSGNFFWVQNGIPSLSPWARHGLRALVYLQTYTLSLCSAITGASNRVINSSTSWRTISRATNGVHRRWDGTATHMSTPTFLIILSRFLEGVKTTQNRLQLNLFWTFWWGEITKYETSKQINQI
jgi:hypothetical protein